MLVSMRDTVDFQQLSRVSIGFSIMYEGILDKARLSIAHLLAKIFDCIVETLG